jgi:hypothetical protein
MARFKDTGYSQGMLIEVKLWEQLLPGTFEWTLEYLINRMDLSLFEQNSVGSGPEAGSFPKMLESLEGNIR